MRRNRPQPAMSDLPPRIARKIRLAREKRSTALDLSRDFWSETGERLTEIPPEVLELDALEVLTLSGNCSNKEGEPFLHLHVILGRRDFSLLGGHLKEARVHPTLEVWLRTETTPAHRRQDEGTGLYLLDLPGRVASSE